LLSFGAVDSGNSPKHAALAIIEDQNKTHKSAGMTIPPLRIGAVEFHEITFLLHRRSGNFQGHRCVIARN
jgi:hypothetical protein